MNPAWTPWATADLTHSLREPVLGDFGTAAPGQSPAAVDRFAETDAELAHLVQLEEQQRQAEAQAALAAKAARRCRPRRLPMPCRRLKTPAHRHPHLRQCLRHPRWHRSPSSLPSTTRP